MSTREEIAIARRVLNAHANTELIMLVTVLIYSLSFVN